MELRGTTEFFPLCEIEGLLSLFKDIKKLFSFYNHIQLQTKATYSGCFCLFKGAGLAYTKKLK